MADIWWKADPHDLHRITDRVSSVYVERSHLDRDENAVVIINKNETVRVPAASVGPGHQAGVDLTRRPHPALGAARQAERGHENGVDEMWEIIQPLLPMCDCVKAAGCASTEAVWCSTQLRSGCQWRMLPHGLMQVSAGQRKSRFPFRGATPKCAPLPRRAAGQVATAVQPPSGTE